MEKEVKQVSIHAIAELVSVPAGKLLAGTSRLKININPNNVTKDQAEKMLSRVLQVKKLDNALKEKLNALYEEAK